MQKPSFFLLVVLSAGSVALADPPAAGKVEPEELTDGSTADEMPGVYRYVDENGEVHYTNSAADIPKGRQPSPVRGGSFTRLSGGPRSPGPIANAPPPLPTLPPPNDSEREHQGREEEAYWRDRFRTAQRHVAEVEASLNADRELARQLEPFSLQTGRCGWGMGPVYGYPRGNYCHSVNEALAVRERVKEKEVTLSHAQQDLADLEREASFKAVPREWRR